MTDELTKKPETEEVTDVELTASEEEARIAEEVLEKFERKRTFGPTLSKIIVVIGVLASCYQLSYAYYHPFFALDHRAIHWIFMSTLIFLLYPATKRWSPKTRPTVIDMVFLIGSVGICTWIFIYSTPILNRAGCYEIQDVVAGTILLIIVLEAARRSTGLAVSTVAIIFLIYAFAGPHLPEVLSHRGYSLERIATYLSLSTDGIFGVPLGVSANFIFLFILYGAILRKTGAGEFFTDIAFALTGTTRGGPAKAAVMSSCMFGMISGSSVANTVTTGSFTIPLMKRTGYPAYFAGAVEASSSTMGQIMPPIMGAAAFLMAEFLGIPYIKVCIAACIPALLSFFGTFMQVHFRAVLMGLKGIDRAHLPNVLQTLRKGWHHLISIIVLITFLVLNYSPERAVFWTVILTLFIASLKTADMSLRQEVLTIGTGLAIFGGVMLVIPYLGLQPYLFIILVAMIITSCLRASSGLKIRDIIDAMVDGAIGSVEVAAACAAAGIIIGTITVTGLGLKFSSLIVDFSGGQLLFALPLTMIACLALGMGVPTTAQYIIISALVAPALIYLGVVPVAAHLFIFYFGTRADITPPVALAAYAGAGVAGSNPMKTGITAFKLGLAGYIVPFMFVFAPEMLIIPGGSVFHIAFATLTALFGVYCLAAAIQNCMIIKTTWFERIDLFVVAFLLIKPGLKTDTLGLALFAIALFLQLRRSGGSFLNMFRPKREAAS